MGRLQSLREERGVSAVIVSVSLIAIFGASMLAIDAGSVWATRRAIVTGTDAAVLGAARLYATGMQDPCNAAGVAAGESEGNAILAANDSRSEHAGLPNPYEVTVPDCSGTGLRTGHVRYDGRLAAQQAFSSIFGFGKVKPFSSSTAEFGWVVEIAGGLRPWTVCLQHNTWDPDDPAPVVLPPPTGAGPFAHYALWNWKEKGEITPATYNGYFGQNPNEYPAASSDNGLNANKNYLSPAAGGGVVHRVNLKDDCGGGASWRGWLDYFSGSNGTSTLRDWIINGYPRSVALDPHDCTPHTSASPDDCDAFPGSHNGLEDALDSITCPAATPSAECFNFPVILNEGVTGVGGSIAVDHAAFIFVILRGFASDDMNNPCSGNSTCLLDMEFIRVQAEGEIGGNPSGGATTPRGTALCGIDHDSTSNRCDL